MNDYRKVLYLSKNIPKKYPHCSSLQEIIMVLTSTRIAFLRTVILAAKTLNDLKDKGDLKGLKRASQNMFGEPRGFCKVLTNCYMENNVIGRGDAELFQDIGMRVSDVFHAQWKHYSGENAYPVPHPDKISWIAFDSEFNEMWVEGEYANNRWKYINDFSDFAKKLLDEEGVPHVNYSL